MQSMLRLILMFPLALFLFVGCASFGNRGDHARTLAPFTTDGCSLFPDGTLENKTLWQDCCIEHDISYWQGGTKEQRRESDEALKICITEVTGDSALGQTVYDGVRAGGSPIYPSWYRWGYGWSYGRMYQPLTEEEQAQVEQRLLQFRAALLEVLKAQ